MTLHLEPLEWVQADVTVVRRDGLLMLLSGAQSKLPIPIWLCSQVHMKGMQPSEERDLDCMLGSLGPSAGSILIRCMSLNKSLISCFVSFGAKNENVPISHGPLLLIAWMSTVSFLFLLQSRLSG